MTFLFFSLTGDTELKLGDGIQGASQGDFYFSIKKDRVGFTFFNDRAIHVSMVHGIVKCQMTMPMGWRML